MALPNSQVVLHLKECIFSSSATTKRRLEFSSLGERASAAHWGSVWTVDILAKLLFVVLKTGSWNSAQNGMWLWSHIQPRLGCWNFSPISIASQRSVRSNITCNNSIANSFAINDFVMLSIKKSAWGFWDDGSSRTTFFVSLRWTDVWYGLGPVWTTWCHSRTRDSGEPAGCTWDGPVQKSHQTKNTTPRCCHLAKVPIEPKESGSLPDDYFWTLGDQILCRQAITTSFWRFRQLQVHFSN